MKTNRVNQNTPAAVPAAVPRRTYFGGRVQSLVFREFGGEATVGVIAPGIVSSFLDMQPR